MRLPMTIIAILGLMVDEEMQTKDLSYVEELLNLWQPENTWSVDLQDLP